MPTCCVRAGWNGRRPSLATCPHARDLADGLSPLGTQKSADGSRRPLYISGFSFNPVVESATPRAPGLAGLIVRPRCPVIRRSLHISAPPSSASRQLGGLKRKDTPIFSAFRHSTLHRLTAPSARTRSNMFGMPTGLAITKHAPASDRSRTRHSVLVRRPRKEMRAPRRTRLRLVLRLSPLAMGRQYA